MKKILKMQSWIIGALLLLVLAFVSYIYFRGIPVYETGKIDFQAKITPKNVARGKKLATLLCAGCHMDRESMKLSGRYMREVPEEFGVVY